MTIREMAEQREVAYFSPYASLSSKSRGRDRQEPPCDIRPVFKEKQKNSSHCFEAMTAALLSKYQESSASAQSSAAAMT